MYAGEDGAIISPSLTLTAEARALLDIIGDGIRIVAPDFRILFENAAHRKLLGDHAGEHCYRAYRQRETVCEGCPISDAFRDNAVRNTLRSVESSSGTRFLEITASSLRDAGGTIIAGIEVVRDVTDRKLWEDERERLLLDLQKAFANIKTLRKLIPICAWCGKARDDKGYWEDLQDYIRSHSDSDFTHGICPTCLAAEDPENAGDIPDQTP